MTAGPKPARVACSVMNGISIRLSKPGYDDGTGVKPMIHDGPPVVLRGPSSLHAGTANSWGAGSEPVVNEVDADWMGRWLEQNAENPLVADGHIKVLREDDEERNPT